MFFFSLFLISTLSTIILVFLFRKEWIKLSYDDTSGIQRFHSDSTPRFAGIVLFLGFLVIYAFYLPNPLVLKFFLAAIPIFLVGLYEDLSGKSPPNQRLFFSILSSILVIFLLDLEIPYFNLPIIDNLNNYRLIQLIVTSIAITFYVNAFNMIDGFNGLLLGFVLTISLVFVYNGSLRFKSYIGL